VIYKKRELKLKSDINNTVSIILHSIELVSKLSCKLSPSIDLVDGTCYGLEAGNIEVDVVVDHCSGYSTSTTLTGWKYARTMLLMEVTSPRLESISAVFILAKIQYYY